MSNIFFSQVSAGFFLWFFSYFCFYSRKAPVLDSLSVCFWVLSERTQTYLLLFCYCLPLLPHFFRPVSFCPKIPAPLPFFCLCSISDLLWSLQGSHSLHFPCVACPCACDRCWPPSGALCCSLLSLADTQLCILEKVLLSQSLFRAIQAPC